MQSLKKIHAWAQMQVPLYPPTLNSNCLVVKNKKKNEVLSVHY